MENVGPVHSVTCPWLTLSYMLEEHFLRLGVESFLLAPVLQKYNGSENGNIHSIALRDDEILTKNKLTDIVAKKSS